MRVLRPQQAVERARHGGRLDQRFKTWNALDCSAVRARAPLVHIRAILGQSILVNCSVKRWIELIRLQHQEPLPEELLHLGIS
jgi:hypothetical protein